MPIATFRHCIVCYKEQEPFVPPPGSRGVSKNSEICRRFCTLASRHLNLDPEYYQWETALNSKLTINNETVCDECLEPTLSFCDIYEQMDNLRMQLSWRLEEVSRIMIHANGEESPNAAFLQALKDKVSKFGGDTLTIENFRKEFLEAVEIKKKMFNPEVYVEVPKVNSDDDDDDDSETLFEACTPVRRQKEEVDKNESPNGTTKDANSSDDDSMFEKCTPVKKKKKKIEVKEKTMPGKRRGRPRKLTNFSSSPSKEVVRPITTDEKKGVSKREGKVNSVPTCEPVMKPGPKSKKKKVTKDGEMKSMANKEKVKAEKGWDTDSGDDYSDMFIAVKVMKPLPKKPKLHTLVEEPGVDKPPPQDK